MAINNLSTPLLHSQPSDEPQLTITVDDEPNDTNTEFVDNPFEFLGSNGFKFFESTTIDPFRNHTLEIEGVYEWVKIGICLPIALVRMVLFGFCLSIGYVSTKIALLGWKDKENPMPNWRCRLMWVTRLATRGILFAFGYHWIKRRGKPSPREIAPIIVSNHVSYVVPIFYFYEIFPTIVAMQVIYVNRSAPSSRKHAISEIKRKASGNRFPRVLLFPDGTTTNGRSLISFQLGAFVPGYAIQPVVVHYPHVHFDQSWGNISLARLMFRMFTQFHNFMEVEYLPVVFPLENQKESAVHFAERTSRVMCTALNVVQTSHSFGDLMLLAKAIESKQVNPSLYMVEMAKVDMLYHISSVEAVQLLEVFLSMKPGSSEHVGIDDFLRVLRLKHCSFSEKVFGFVDIKKTGQITFKELNVLKQPLFGQACELAFAGHNTDGERYISEQEVHEFFKLFDCESDGRISRDNFMACLRRNPLLIFIFSPKLSRLNLSSERAQEKMVMDPFL